MYATVGMLLATVLIGCIPTTRQCGSACKWLGFALMLTLRLVQGLCAAGEISIALTLAFEQSGRRSAGMGVATVLVAGTSGFLVASAITTWMEMVTTVDQRLDWGWRVPFWLALPIGIPVLCLQRRMEESHEFEAMRAHPGKGGGEAQGKAMAGAKEQPPSPPSLPSRSGPARWLTSERAPFIICWGVVAVQGSWHYGLITYFKDLIINEGVVATSEAGYAATLALVACIGSELLWGLLIDLSSLRLMACIAMPMLLAGTWPVWVLLTGQHHVDIGAIAAGLLYGSHVVFVSISIAVFPTAVRATAFGLAYNVSQLCFGAFAPHVNNAMVDVLRSSGMPTWLYRSLGPSLWTYFAMAVAAATLCYAFRHPRFVHVFEAGGLVDSPVP